MAFRMPAEPNSKSKSGWRGHSRRHQLDEKRQNAPAEVVAVATAIAQRRREPLLSMLNTTTKLVLHYQARIAVLEIPSETAGMRDIGATYAS